MKKIITLLLLLAPAYIISNKDRVFEMHSASASSSLSSSSAAYDEDDVAAEIMGDVTVKSIVSEHLKDMPKEQKGAIEKALESLSDEEFAAYLSKLGATRWWDSKKAEDKKTVGLALMALVEQFKEQNEELKRQTEQMQESSEHAEKVHQYNVRQARKVAITGAVTTIVSLLFNLLQAAGVFADSEGAASINGTAC